MNREIYNKIREFSIDMYTQGFSDGYTDGSTRGCEVEKAQEYKRGFQNGYSKGWDEAYKKGLNDAWEAARKITDWTIEDLESRKLSVNDCDDEYEYSCRVLEKYSASEAIDRIREYEERKKHYRCIDCSHYNGGQWNIFCARCEEFSEYEKRQNSTKQGCGNYESAQNEDDDEIRVGDEVIFDDKKYVAIFITPSGFVKVLDEDGKWEMIFDKNDITKTGHHFSQISEMLDQMKEENKE